MAHSGLTDRHYSSFASESAKRSLGTLLDSEAGHLKYREAMKALGHELGQEIVSRLDGEFHCLLASTAEDADFLSRGILDELSQVATTSIAVFWNHHYQIPGSSVAPIVHEFLQPGHESANCLVIAKSVISGSCVVRTNIISLLETHNFEKIVVTSPVVHKDSEKKLYAEFPREIADKFEFIYLVEDVNRSQDGEVVPGIGGQVYGLLGVEDQPAKTGYMPQLVKKLLVA